MCNIYLATDRPYCRRWHGVGSRRAPAEPWRWAARAWASGGVEGGGDQQTCGSRHAFVKYGGVPVEVGVRRAGQCGAGARTRMGTLILHKLQWNGIPCLHQAFVIRLEHGNDGIQSLWKAKARVLSFQIIQTRKQNWNVRWKLKLVMSIY